MPSLKKQKADAKKTLNDLARCIIAADDANELGRLFADEHTIDERIWLRMAVQHRSVACLKLLSQRGLTINDCSMYSMIGTEKPVDHQDDLHEKFELLESCGFFLKDFQMSSADVKTIHAYANDAIYEYIVARCDVKNVTEIMFTAVTMSTEAMANCLARGHSIDGRSKNDPDETPLQHLIVISHFMGKTDKHVAHVQWLVDHGADVDIWYDYFKTQTIREKIQQYDLLKGIRFPDDSVIDVLDFL